MVFIGKVLTFIERFSPGFARGVRRSIVQTIISKHSFGWKERVDNMMKLDRFLNTVPEADRKLIIEELNIPTWAGNSPFRGAL